MNKENEAPLWMIIAAVVVFVAIIVMSGFVLSVTVIIADGR